MYFYVATITEMERFAELKKKQNKTIWLVMKNILSRSMMLFSCFFLNLLWNVEIIILYYVHFPVRKLQQRKAKQAVSGGGFGKSVLIGIA